MGIFDIFKKKQPEISEAERRQLLLQYGRITEGRIVDSDTTEQGDEIVYYFYSIQGVDFESSQILSETQKQNLLEYSPGAKVGIRFDPKNHGNSILV